MYLSNLKLWNFRKFGSNKPELDLGNPDLGIPFNKGLNVLIGENDSGKTVIIDAIKLVLRTHSLEWIRLENEDFYKSTSRLRIECRFEDLSDDEAKNFIEWLGMDGEGESVKPYLRVILDAGRKGNKILPYDIRAGVDDEGYQLTAGAKDYLKTTFLKPLRDAKSELIPRKNSRLSQIMMGHPTFKDKDENHEMLEFFQELSEKIETYFKDDSKEGKKIRNTLENLLGKFFGENKTVNFSVAEHKLKNILETLKLSLEDRNLGLGSQNLLFIATELLNLEREDWDGLRLGLIEEIEAHLHPQAQLRIVEFLQDESIKENLQIIITTHSPNIGSKVQLNNLFICHDKKVFPMGYHPKKHTELDEPDYKFLERFLDVTKANLFFAKGLIFVEGWSEEILLPALAKKIGINLTEKGVSIINVGNTAFLRYTRIFQRKDDQKMKIPIAVITDLDVEPDKENETIENENITRKQFVIKNKIEKYSGQIVKTFVSTHWTLEYCLSLSKTLARPLYIATRLGGREMQNDGYSGKRINETWRNFSKSKTQKDIASSLYTEFIKSGKKISKPIIAQHLANLIEKSNISKDELGNDKSIDYLLKAIKYAAREK